MLRSWEDFSNEYSTYDQNEQNTYRNLNKLTPFTLVFNPNDQKIEDEYQNSHLAKTLAGTVYLPKDSFRAYKYIYDQTIDDGTKKANEEPPPS